MLIAASSRGSLASAAQGLCGLSWEDGGAVGPPTQLGRMEGDTLRQIYGILRWRQRQVREKRLCE